jgi:hypothetical protein
MKISSEDDDFRERVEHLDSLDRSVSRSRKAIAPLGNKDGT